MYSLQSICIFLIVLYYVITRGLPRLLSWFLVVKYETEIVIGRISLLGLCFEDVFVKKSGLSIKIEKIGVSSSLVNQEERKILALIVHDVRIEKEVPDRRSKPVSAARFIDDVDNIFSAALQPPVGVGEVNPVQLRIPPSVVTLAQFFGIHIVSLSLVYLREKWPECLVHASAEKISLEGATVNQANVALTINVTGAHVKVLQHAHDSEMATEGSEFIMSVSSLNLAPGGRQDPTLLECAGSFKVSLEANAETFAAMENFSVQLIEPQLTVRERLLTFMANKALAATPIEPNSVGKHPIQIDVLLVKYWLFVPLKTRVKVEKVSVKLVNHAGLTAFLGSIGAVDLQTHLNREGALENFPVMLPDFSTELQIDNWQIQSMHNSSVLLSRFNIQTQFVGDRININAEFRSLHIEYDHQDVAFWSGYLLPHRLSENRRPAYVPQISEPDHANVKWGLRRYCLGMIVELWDVSCGGHLPDGSPYAQSTLTHLRHSFAVTQDVGQLAGEVLLELLVITVGGRRPLSGGTLRGVEGASASSRKVHLWGTPVCIGLCLVQFSSSFPSGGTDALWPLQMEALVDNVHLEWSAKLAQCLIAVSRHAFELRHRRHVIKSTTKNYSKSQRPQELVNSITVKCTNVNLFAHSQPQVSIMVRVDNFDSQTVTKKQNKMTISGIKLTRFMPTGTQYFCLKSSEIKDEWCEVSSVTLEKLNGDYLMSATDQLRLTWSTTTHMTLFTLAQEVFSFAKELHGPFTPTGVEGMNKIGQSLSQPMKSSLNVQLIARGEIKLGAILSKRHKILFDAGDVTFLMARGRMSFQSEKLQVHMDEHSMMTLTGVKMAYTLESLEIKQERESVDELQLKQNRAWKVTVDTWTTKFPFEYNFSEAFSEELVTVVKWVKRVHKRQSQPFPPGAPLPPDIVIRVRQWSVEVCDDPFEVKLRYNYELMDDEYKESCKRLRALDARVDELRKTHFRLPQAKVEELYHNLQEKNSETYINRSKKMYAQAPVRTHLFVWSMEDVVIYVLADSTFHGTENVLEHMRDIDKEGLWPEEEMDFCILWCRMVSASCTSWRFQLRDYPQSLLDIHDFEIYGRLIGAEPKAGKRAMRSVSVEIEAPWQNESIERTMATLKFYHDFFWEVKTLTLAYGPCWEPAWAQFHLAMNNIVKPSYDPSTPLPWWDKSRLILHGRLTLTVRERMTLLLHASLDPYNTTEEIELTWKELTMDWTNAKFMFKGDLYVYVRTASKYDDARLMYFPGLKLTIKLTWLCRGNANDHHMVTLCAPDKLPEYSSNQEHDSYRVFRSQSMKMNIVFETKTFKKGNLPTIEFYGSTIRWFENLKFILSGVARPIRRGPLFKNNLPKKLHLSHHYNCIHLSVSFQKMEVNYWMSAGIRKGFYLCGEKLSVSSEHNMTLKHSDDGLHHRSITCWDITYLNTGLGNVDIWLQSGMASTTGDSQAATGGEEGNASQPHMQSPVEKFFFLTLDRVEYQRSPLNIVPPAASPDPSLKDIPNYRLIVQDLKGAWTTNNRDIALALYDAYDKARQLRRNISPAILKSMDALDQSTPQKPRSRSLTDTNGLGGQNFTSPPASLMVPTVQATPSPMSRLQTTGYPQTLLQQLIAEADNNPVAHSEDCSNPEPREHTLQGVKACTSDEDVINKKWLIELKDSQVLLKGCDTKGYVILSAAKAQIVQRVHRPVWRDHSLMAKTSWYGSLECMQYYATVSPRDSETQIENIMWLTKENIEEKEGQVISEVTDIVGSGQSVGGVVSKTVGVTDTENDSNNQLQRIVSRCRCEFYYLSFGEMGLDPSMLEEVHPLPPEENLWSRRVEACDTFTLMHHDLCISTNHLQYNMVVDILNNLFLFVDPKKKQAGESVARMRFQLQLYSRDDMRKPIVKLQNQVRNLLSKLRSLEKDVYMAHRQLDKEPGNIHIAQRKSDMEKQVFKCKEELNGMSEELATRIHCFNESQLSANHKLQASGGNKQVKILRMNEVCFRKAQWRLTESDGQLGIAKLMLSNFLYTKKTKSDDSGEHLFELGYINMQNLLPNQMYEEVLSPSEIHSNMPVDRQRALRVFCREKPPCGGISIIEHFEINVVPLNISLTDQFYKTMMKFCFPDNTSEKSYLTGRKDNSGGLILGKQRQTPLKRPGKDKDKESSFYVSLQDDVEIMKQRAEQNKLFVYIKIPELPVRFSYKGKKDKSIVNAVNFRLVVPTLEYHNVTWTWLDFLLAMKSDSKSALLSQAIKHKLNLAQLRADDAVTHNEEEKARILLGTKLMPQELRTSKKNLFKFK